MDGARVQVVFLFFPSVTGKDTERQQESPSHKCMAERLVKMQEFWDFLIM